MALYSPRHAKRTSWLSNDDNRYAASPRKGSLASLFQARTHQTGNGDVSGDEEIGGMARGPLARDEDDIDRLLKDERRINQILNPPQARSRNLIGKNNPRYRWEGYWKHRSQLQDMSKPLRKYYERTNELIEQYMYIDLLLDSAIPHEILDEYATELEASAFSVPETIREDSSATNSSAPPSAAAAGSPSASYRTLASSGEPTNGSATHKKRTPKDIFRASEQMPLLERSQSETDLEEGRPRRVSVSSALSGPRPNLPWLENAELDSDDPIVTWAIWVNMIANVILLAGKIVVLASVPSLSVLASLVDAVLDFLSTAIVWTTTRLISSSQEDQYRYPVGRKRLEPVGVLVFSIIMITSFAQVALEAFQRLLGSDHSILQLGIPAISIMVGTILIKGVVWLWCRLIKNSSVQALAEDAVTDVIFNTGSILFPIVGFYAHVWWLDALGGLLLSLVVMFNWSKTSAHHVRNLTGFSAQPDERNLLLYLTMRFATSIRKIQNLRAYHAGDKLFVEVDIVLGANTPLKDSHDLSEVLTYFLESVPIVDRAFVHVDYVSYNAPTHIQK